jgi:hypothetical protein
VLFRKRIHARGGREVVGPLLAAVEHDDEGQRLPVIDRRYVDLVFARAGGVRIAAGEEPAWRVGWSFFKRCRRGRAAAQGALYRLGRSDQVTATHEAGGMYKASRDS